LLDVYYNKAHLTYGRVWQYPRIPHIIHGFFLNHSCEIARLSPIIATSLLA